MAQKGQNSIQDLLKTLSLEKFYPGKLTTSELYEISELSLEERESLTEENVSWHFINRLTRLNYHARNLKIETQFSGKQPTGYLQRKKMAQINKTSNIHPMDIIVAVFLCCDAIAKQDLVRCLWACKLSVPFIITPDKSKSPGTYLWPLRCLVSQWQYKDDKTSHEYSIVTYPMQKVGCIRVGDLDESKSALLNVIIGGPEKAHPMFFHRDSYGSKKQRSEVINGLVELGWFFPKGAEADSFDRCMLFANLRGDASENKEQTQLLVKSMDTLVILSHTKYLNSNCKILRNSILNSSKALLVLTDTHINENEEEEIKKFLTCLGSYSENAFEIITLEDMRLAEKIDLVNTHIRTFTNDTETTQLIKSLEEVFIGKISSEANIDEVYDKDITEGIRSSNVIIQEIESTDQASRKTKLFPIQGDKWKHWTKTEIEMHRLDIFREKDTKQDVSSYRNSLEEKKFQLRSEQFSVVQRLPSVLKQFLSCLKDLDDTRLKVFLRSLKLGLDEISRTMLRPYYEKYNEILAEKAQADEIRRDDLQKQLEDLDKGKAQISFGLEHFIREMGQIFEAVSSQDPQSSTFH